MEGGALGLSVSRNKGHYDPQGVHIPALWADEKEIFALADVLREMGTGIIQSGGGRDAEMDNGLMARLSEATGRPVVYNNLGQSVRRPGEWQKHMARVNETSAQGIRAYPLVLAEHDDADLQHEEHPGLPRLADLASDPLEVGRGEDAGLCRPGGARQTARRDGRVEGRDPRQHDLARMVQLHLGRGRASSTRTSGCRARPSTRSPRRRTRGSSTPSSISRSRKSSKPPSCRPRTTSTSRR